MPQPGIHAMLALATRSKLGSKPLFATGVVMGAMIPDLDGYAQAFATLALHMSADQAEAICHRTLTHSLLLSGLLALVSWFPRWWLGLGIALGMSVFHSILDIFAWFDGVGILWPFASIDLWPNHPDGWQGGLLRAGNFLAFAGLFAMLFRRSRQRATNVHLQSKAKMLALVNLLLGLIFGGLVFVLPSKTYNLVDGAALLLFAFPSALVLTWRMRETIEA